MTPGKGTEGGLGYRVPEQNGHDESVAHQQESHQEVHGGVLGLGDGPNGHVRRRMKVKVDSSHSSGGLGVLELFFTLVVVCAMREGPAIALGTPVRLLPVDELDFTFTVLGRRSATG